MLLSKITLGMFKSLKQMGFKYRLNFSENKLLKTDITTLKEDTHLEHRHNFRKTHKDVCLFALLTASHKQTKLVWVWRIKASQTMTIPDLIIRTVGFLQVFSPRIPKETMVRWTCNWMQLWMCKIACDSLWGPVWDLPQLWPNAWWEKLQSHITTVQTINRSSTCRRLQCFLN